LRNAVTKLVNSANDFKALTKVNQEVNQEVNNLLYTIERLMTRNEGLPGREWYKHYIYAPGYYTGYGVKTIPAVREAIEQREFDQVENQINLSAEVVEKIAARIDAIIIAAN
jgi:N-acetylated-alpha-linked acidic dipeptidase